MKEKIKIETFLLHFQQSLSARKGISTTPILHLWNILHAKPLIVVAAPATSTTKKHP